MDRASWMQAACFMGPVLQHAFGAKRVDVVAGGACGPKTEMGADLPNGGRPAGAAGAVVDELEYAALGIGKGFVHASRLPHARVGSRK